MKTIDSGLLAVYQSAAQTITDGVTITRADGEVFRWVSHDRDIELAGETYTAQPGVQLSSLVSTAGLAVDNAEVTVLEDADITRLDLLAGRWDGAEVEIFQFDCRSAFTRLRRSSSRNAASGITPPETIFRPRPIF